MAVGTFDNAFVSGSIRHDQIGQMTRGNELRKEKGAEPAAATRMQEVFSVGGIDLSLCVGKGAAQQNTRCSAFVAAASSVRESVGSVGRLRAAKGARSL
mmetsp:Transcript_14635/g.27968  ORF Transcript_14635/g.27968 Transcript_14635/m.27968 type:complete len:99 (-) Transcript_14635:16-312(-)